MIIPPNWSLPEAIQVRLGQSTFGRQRAIFEEDHLLLILHKPPGPDDRGRDGVLFWRSPDGEWRHHQGLPGAGALRQQVQSYAEIESQLAHAYEGRPDLTTLFDLIDKLTPLVRASRNMHEALQAARDFIKKDALIIEARDMAYEVNRNLEVLYEDVRNAIQYRTAREAEEQAHLSRQALQASHRLNILAALFFPLTAVASLFGMNLAHGLNEHRILIFWAVTGVSILLGMVLKSWVLARRAPPSPPPRKIPSGKG